MKYLVFDEISKEDWDKILVNIDVHNEERKKGNLPPHIIPDHILLGDLPQFTQPMRSFKIYDTDDPKQLANIEALYTAIDVQRENGGSSPSRRSRNSCQPMNNIPRKSKDR